MSRIDLSLPPSTNALWPAEPRPCASQQKVHQLAATDYKWAMEPPRRS
jgi:hypothetical protein